MAPVIDVGTFAIGRMGVSGHPVAWAWRKASTPGVVDEHYALYRPGDAAEGFLRPRTASVDLGFRFAFIPAAGGGPIDFPGFPGFRAYVRSAASGCGMDPDDLVFVRSDPTSPGTVPVFLGTGFLRVRHMPGTVDDVVAWALRKAPTFQERWRLGTAPVGDPGLGYQTPGAAHPLVDLWFNGAPEIEWDEFDPVVQGEATTPLAATVDYFGHPDP